MYDAVSCNQRGKFNIVFNPLIGFPCSFDLITKMTKHQDIECIYIFSIITNLLNCRTRTKKENDKNQQNVNEKD